MIRGHPSGLLKDFVNDDEITLVTHNEGTMIFEAERYGSGSVMVRLRTPAINLLDLHGKVIEQHPDNWMVLLLSPEQADKLRQWLSTPEQMEALRQQRVWND